MFKALVLLSVSAVSVLSLPSGLDALMPRAAPDNTVAITDATHYCMIVPRQPHTNVGDSEHPGGMMTYCSPEGVYDPSQGTFAADFWKNVEFKSGNGTKGGRWVQLTGCINAATCDRLNPADAGGQYDSNGGPGGQGNPQGSACMGYKSYVELMEPRGPRACIRCCEDPADCPVTMDESGCPNVVPGNYFDCGG